MKQQIQNSKQIDHYIISVVDFQSIIRKSPSQQPIKPVVDFTYSKTLVMLIYVIMIKRYSLSYPDGQ